MIKFNVLKLDHQELDLDGYEPPAFLEIESSALLQFNKPVHYQLHIAKINQGALVTGSVTTTANGCCGRCLENFTTTISNNNICRFYEEIAETELDITDDIREELVINIPSNCICDADCNGLCPVCGNNRNLKPCDCQPETGGSDVWGELDKLKL